MTVVVGGAEEGLPRGFRIVPELTSDGVQKEVLVDGRYHWVMKLERADLSLDDNPGGWVEWSYVESMAYPHPSLSPRTYEHTEKTAIKDLIKIAQSYQEAEDFYKEEAAVSHMFPEEAGWTTVDS